MDSTGRAFESDFWLIRRQYEGDIDMYRIRTKLSPLPGIAESANQKVGSINIVGAFYIFRSTGPRQLLIPVVMKQN